MWVTMRQVFHYKHAGCLHVACDAGRAGGRESEIAVLYSSSAQAAAWMPPMAEASVLLCERMHAIDCVQAMGARGMAEWGSEGIGWDPWQCNGVYGVLRGCRGVAWGR
eukprot:2907063-Lingulodinium_polyedra.AAC.1